MSADQNPKSVTYPPGGGQAPIQPPAPAPKPKKGKNK